MWEILWGAVVIAVFGFFAFVLLATALGETTVTARIAPLVLLAAGVTLGLELWNPWLQLALWVVAFALYAAGRRRQRHTVRRPPADPVER